jgi:hypothetical protein
MSKFFKISFLSVLLLTNVFINAEFQNKNIEAAPVQAMNENSQTQASQQVAQPNLVALSKEESQELLQSLSKEETELLNKFLEALTKKLESLKDESIVSEMAEVFAEKGISWNVTLSVYPCKQELKIVDSVENNMVLNS